VLGCAQRAANGGSFFKEEKAMAKVDSTLTFDGRTTYIEIPDAPDFSIATTGELSIAAWIRPDTLSFPVSQNTGYVHWMGKGAAGQQEWVFRMYNETTTDDPQRPNRISFYVFNSDGRKGIGSHFQDPVQAGEWIHVVGVADSSTTAIYKNGVFRRCDRYTGTGPKPCHNYTQDLWVTPTRGSAPMRIGTRDLESFFLGAIREVRVWNRALTAAEVAALFGGTPPQDGLVAEYLLGRDVAVDTADGRDGVIVGGAWVAS
jgi:hypothetical protein